MGQCLGQAGSLTGPATLAPFPTAAALTFGEVGLQVLPRFVQDIGHLDSHGKDIVSGRPKEVAVLQEAFGALVAHQICKRGQASASPQGHSRGQRDRGAPQESLSTPAKPVALAGATGAQKPHLETHRVGAERRNQPFRNEPNPCTEMLQRVQVLSSAYSTKVDTSLIKQ